MNSSIVQGQESPKELLEKVSPKYNSELVPVCYLKNGLSRLTGYNSNWQIKDLNVEPKENAIQILKGFGQGISKILCDTEIDSPTLKEKCVDSNKMEIVGEEWLADKAFRFFCVPTVVMHDLIAICWVKRSRNIWNTICYSTLIAFYIILLSQGLYSFKDLGFYIVVILIILCTINMCLTCHNIYFDWMQGRNESSVMFNLNIGFWLSIIGLSTVVLLNIMDKSIIIAWIIVAAEISANLIDFINIVLWITIAPLLFIFFWFELLVRVILGKTECPKLQPIKIIYKYRMFQYNSILFSSDTSCAICLEKYNEHDKSLCMLDCQINHIFHEKCIFEWLQNSLSCPICRKSAKFRI